MKVRMPGYGDAASHSKGQAGDLLVRMAVTESPIFKRTGINLYHEAKIPFYQAILGGSLRIPTLDGPVDVKLPAGSQQNEEMVLRGHGVPSIQRTGKGDLIIRFQITMPRYVCSPCSKTKLIIPLRALSVEQKDLIKQFAATCNDLPSPSKSSTSESASSAETGESCPEKLASKAAGFLGKAAQWASGRNK